MKQTRTIDYLKAFAIIMVVFYHAIISLDICYHDLTYICITLALKAIHVPLFLLIAGYLCHKQDIKTFYLKKVKRILIPFLFMTAMKLIFNNVLSTEFTHGESIPQQIYNAFICGELYWFCYAMLIMFAVAPLLWNRKALKWILLGVTIAANMILMLLDVSLTDVLQLHNVLFYCPFFLIGMLLQDYRIAEWSGRIRLICLLILLAAGAFAGYLRYHEDVHNIYVIDVIIGLCAMYILYLLARLIPNRGPVDWCLHTAGKYSLQIMMLDPFLRMALYLPFSLFMENGTLLALIMTFLNVALCCVICLIAERIPVLSTLMGLSQVKRNN